MYIFYITFPLQQDINEKNNARKHVYYFLNKNETKFSEMHHNLYTIHVKKLKYILYTI